MLITVRDPVDRAVSAFEFRHPTRGENAVRFPRSDFELRLYKCYDSVRDWVGGLGATGECGDLARAAINPTDRVAHGRSSQLDKGLVYYLDALRDLLPTLEYTLVWQEQLEDDARRALRWLGWPARRRGSHRRTRPTAPAARRISPPPSGASWRSIWARSTSCCGRWKPTKSGAGRAT